MKRNLVEETMRLLNENKTIMEERKNLFKYTGDWDQWNTNHSVESAGYLAGSPNIVLELLGYMYGPEYGDSAWDEEKITPIEDIVEKYADKCEYIAVAFNDYNTLAEVYQIDKDSNIIKKLGSVDL